ncbi:MAG: methylenetetrahydrofolate reductase [Gammaproteobacteria bacterium]|nr:methylenetetrahydrofolate reductase [Gammaproteobacteria bacterium]
MKFRDEPVPGDPLPILPGHVSPGRFERVLRAGAFAVTAELAPPDSADPEEVYARARIFDGYVDAINATDGSGANCHMSSMGVCSLLTRVGYAPIMQISCRDRNRIGIQGDILGASAMGVCNVLCLTGDGVQAGDHPQAKPVFDLDSVSLLSLARTLRDEQRFQSGRKLSKAPRVFLGAANRIFLLIGVGPLRSAKAAEWMRQNVPGIHIPDALITRLRGAADPAREGRNICIELIQEVHAMKGVHGVHVMAYRQEESVAEVIDKSGVLAGRVPWYPGRDRQDPAQSNTADTNTADRVAS